MENDTRRYSYTKRPKVIDFGLSHDDIDRLTPEEFKSNISDERLEEAGIDQEAIDFLRGQRVELNAMTSRQLVNFVEGKLRQHRIGKIIPSRETLAKTYKTLVASDRLAAAFEELQETLEEEAPITPPDDLEAKVKKLLKEKPEITWHRAIRLIVDPDAPEEDDDNEGIDAE